MNYEPNEINWKIGDIVIHDADAKKESMLMKVVSVEYNDLNLYETIYINPPYNDLDEHFFNDKKFLHNPKIFGIDISKFTLLSQSAKAESLIADKREPKALQIGKDT